MKAATGEKSSSHSPQVTEFGESRPPYWAAMNGRLREKRTKNSRRELAWSDPIRSYGPVAFLLGYLRITAGAQKHGASDNLHSSNRRIWLRQHIAFR